VIITLKSIGRRAIDVENSLNNGLQSFQIIYLNQSHSIAVTNFLIGSLSAI